MTLPETRAFRRRLQRKGIAFSVIEGIASDPETPIGARLEILRRIGQVVEREQMRLHMQLGCDVAKHLASLGIAPSGRPIGETLKEIDTP